MQRRHITVQLLLTIAISSLSISSLAADKVDTIRPDRIAQSDSTTNTNTDAASTNSTPDSSTAKAETRSEPPGATAGKSDANSGNAGATENAEASAGKPDANISKPEGSIVTPEATGKVDASSAKPETINGTPEATGKVNASSTTPEAIIGTPDANKKTEAAAEPEWMKAHKAAGALVAQRLFRQAIAQLKPVFEADPTNETLRVDMQKLYMGAALQNLREGKIGDFDELINAGLALKPSPDIEKHFRAVQKEIEPIRALPPEKQTSALLELTKDLK